MQGPGKIARKHERNFCTGFCLPRICEQTDFKIFFSDMSKYILFKHSFY